MPATTDASAGGLSRGPGMLIFIIGRPYSVISTRVFSSMPVICALVARYWRFASTSALPMATGPVPVRICWVTPTNRRSPYSVSSVSP